MRFTVCRTATLLQPLVDSGRAWVAMITVTYAKPGTWEARHVTQLVKCLQMHARRNFGGPVPIVWTAELTKQGRVHYHLAVWVPTGHKLPFADDRGWWPHGSSNTIKARFAPGYLAKYLSKGGDTAKFPPGLRLYGLSGVPLPVRDQLRFEKAPQWVKSGTGATIGHDLHPNPGGGWIARATGQVERSPFIVVSMSRKGPVLVKLDRPPPVWRLSNCTPLYCGLSPGRVP